MTDLVTRLRELADDIDVGQYVVDLGREAAKEIESLRKTVDALTVKLNKELNERYLSEELLKARCDSLEHRLSRISARVEQLRYAKEGPCSSSPGSSQE